MKLVLLKAKGTTAQSLEVLNLSQLKEKTLGLAFGLPSLSVSRPVATLFFHLSFLKENQSNTSSFLSEWTYVKTGYLQQRITNGLITQRHLNGFKRYLFQGLNQQTQPRGDYLSWMATEAILLRSLCGNAIKITYHCCICPLTLLTSFNLLILESFLR